MIECDVSVSPYAIGAVVCASLAIVLIIVFVLIALKMRVSCHNSYITVIIMIHVDP